MYRPTELEELLAAEMAAAIEESFLPKSDATNAYELLDDACVFILEEPRRYDQSTWIGSLGRGSFDWNYMADVIPPCGTMVCIAGMCLLSKGISLIETMDSGKRAADLLGFKYSHRTSDYGLRIDSEEEQDATRDIRNLFADDLLDGIPYDDAPKRGTAEYAKLGVDRIRTFMAKYEARLKAKEV